LYRIAWIVAGCVLCLTSGPAARALAQTAASDTTRAPATADSTIAPDSLRTFTAKDTLGVPGVLKGQTVDNPDSTKKVLQRMGSNQAEGRTQWERQKNPKVAMLCHTLLPGLGQVYNGRRLKVGLMVGFASYYYGNAWLNYKQWHAAEARRDLYEEGTREFNHENDLAGFYEEEARSFLWWSGAVWLLGLIDSWIDAHLYDVRSYTPPKPVETETPHAANEHINYLTVGFTLERSKK
jgi:hypothetical protein